MDIKKPASPEGPAGSLRENLDQVSQVRVSVSLEKAVPSKV